MAIGGESPRLTLRGIAAAISLLVFAVTFGDAAAMQTGPPSRGKIVFKRYLDSTHDSAALFTMNPNGNAVRQLTQPPHDALDAEPVWSPTGTRVAFQRTQSGRTNIYLIGANGRGERRLPIPRADQGADSPAWSPDGSKLAIGLRQENREVIAVVSTAGDVLAQVTQRDAQNSTLIDSQPAWSPNGKRLTFVRQTAVPSKNGLEALFIIDDNGTHLRRISPWSLRAGHHPVWSSRGTRVVFTSNADGADPHLPSNLYTVRPNGKELRRLTHAGAGQRYLSASYAPGGRWIIFAMQPSPGANAQVFIMHADGTDRHAVTSPSAWSSAPDWTEPNATTR